MVLTIQKTIVSFFIMCMTLYAQDQLPHKMASTDSAGVRVYMHSGIYAADVVCMNAWFRYFGYPVLSSGSGSGGAGMYLFWGKGWKTGGEIFYAASGIQSAGGYKAQYRSSGMNIWVSKRVLYWKKIALSPLAGIEARNMKIELQKDLSAQSSLDNLLSDQTPAGMTLSTDARNVVAGLEAGTRLGNRIQLSGRCVWSGGSRNRWEVNQQTLYDSPTSGIRGFRYDIIISLDL